MLELGSQQSSGVFLHSSHFTLKAWHLQAATQGPSPMLLGLGESRLPSLRHQGPRFRQGAGYERLEANMPNAILHASKSKEQGARASHLPSVPSKHGFWGSVETQALLPEKPSALSRQSRGKQSTWIQVGQAQT